MSIWAIIALVILTLGIPVAAFSLGLMLGVAGEQHTITENDDALVLIIYLIAVTLGHLVYVL